MVSASLLGSSILDNDARISGGTFLFSLTYCSNCVSNERASTSASRSSSASDSSVLTSASNMFSPISKRSIRALSPPSTSTLTVPSGSLSNCKMLEIVPIWYISSGPGSSCEASFCAISKTRLSLSIARSSASIDFSRPTNKGITICG